MTAKLKIRILGAGGHGRVVAEIAALNGYTDIEFADARYPALTQNLIWPVVANSLESLEPAVHCFVAIGNCGARRLAVAKLVAAGRHVPLLIHPRAVVSSLAQLGPGSVVMAQAAINPGAVIGQAAIINTGATVDHDCRIGDGVHVSPGSHLAGRVTVGDETWVGIGSAVRELITIGEKAMIGAGAVVVKSVPDNAIVMGAPARQKE
jgi:sugar O-acyltransferase (sialic acid O-acetyltransferase NeuD family)